MRLLAFILSIITIAILPGIYYYLHKPKDFPKEPYMYSISVTTRKVIYDTIYTDDPKFQLLKYLNNYRDSTVLVFMRKNRGTPAVSLFTPYNQYSSKPYMGQLIGITIEENCYWNTAPKPNWWNPPKEYTNHIDSLKSQQ